MGLEVPPDDDPTVRWAERLDAYVTAIQKREAHIARQLLDDEPLLADWTDCLRQLDEFSLHVAADLPQGDDIPFGKFVLRGELGRGGMGVVYRAYQSDLDRTVALKLLTASPFAAPDQRRRFLQEARLASRIRHPNIVTIHEVGELGGQPYFTMDLVAGTNLAALLRRGPLPVDQAVRLMVSVAKAVAHLHQHGVLHRDLKPSNILLDEEGRPCLVDFGLARAVDDGHEPTVTGTILGTPSYMPPEQAAGRVRELDERSDVYSLGAILYEMLSGRPPFQGDSPFDTVLHVLEREPLSPRTGNRAIPKDLERICLRCLEKSPQRRYASAQELAHDLERWLIGERPAFPSRSPAFRISRTIRRHPSAAYRLFGLAPAMLVIVLRATLAPGTWSFYGPILLGLATWTGLSLLWEWRSWKPQGPRWTPYAFVLTDTVLLTMILHVIHSADVPYVAAYVLIVLMAGLSLDRRLIWFAGAGTVAGYLSLVMRGDAESAWHVPLMVVILLACCTAVTDYQVRRLSLWIRPTPENSSQSGRPSRAIGT